MTYDSPEWDPSDERFAANEAATTDANGNLLDAPSPARSTVVSAFTKMSKFGQAMRNNVHITYRSHNIKAIDTGKRRVAVGPKVLAKRWKIGLDAARRTLDATTQLSIRSTLHPTLSRRFRTNDRQLRYRRLAHDVFTDTLKARTASWFRQNLYAQVFCTRFGWTRIFPMKTKSEAHEGLSLMFQRDGVPPTIIMDGSKEQTMGEFRKKARAAGCRIKQTEPYSPFSNAAEGAIRETKRAAGRKMVASRCPRKLWDHCIELEALLRSHTALTSYELQGQVPETIVSGQTADISPLVEYEWFEWVKYIDVPAAYPEPKEGLGRWLGPAIDIGPAMTAKIIKSNGQIIYSSSHRGLSQSEQQDKEQVKEMDEFMINLHAKVNGGAVTPDELSSIDPDAPTPEHELYEDGDGETHDRVPDIDDVTPEMHDGYIGAQVNLPFQGTSKSGTVKRRALNPDGELEGTANANPILDSRTYQVEFDDGELAAYSANVIAENMYAQCDMDGNQYRLIDSLVGHRTNGTEVKMADRFITVRGRQHPRKTTVGWSLCVLWKNGESSWERLADLKESCPVEVAEYATAQGIDHEPAFCWWVPRVLKKRDRIISAVSKRFLKRTHKFGIEVPRTVDDAMRLDRENGNTLWMDAVATEMNGVRVAFKVLDDGLDEPVGHQFIKCHMIFDVKLDGFRRKARMVAGGHMTAAPDILTYCSVVSRDSVRIALTMAALNDLEVKTSDIQNAYLTSPCEERIWTVLGPEFGGDAGRKAVIVRALYGLKSAGASFGKHLADCMRTLNYKSCKADPDVWMKEVVRPEDGLRYYSYILLYVDDVLCIHHDAVSAIKQIDKYFPMKKGSIGDPDIYLGTKLRQVELTNGVNAWSMSPAKYVKDAVRNVEKYLMKNGGRRLRNRCTAPWPNDYVSETDDTPELDAERAAYYQSLIGVLHWMVEIGRVDIITEVSKLASHMALPREGHLEAVFNVFGYLRGRSGSRMVFDPSYPDIDMSSFKTCDWTEFYGDATEAIPPDMPEPLAKEVDLRLYVDSDHAGDTLTRRSRTGFFIFMNSAPVMWVSKRQATIETSVFGAEFVAMKHGMETMRGLRYKLRMMGIPLSGPSYMYGDNMSVIHNTQRPESMLKKKSNSICYHAMREAVAMKECMTGHVRSENNPADIATKVLRGGAKRDHLIGYVLYDIVEENDDDVANE